MNRCIKLLKDDSRILFLGLIQACFEASMYSFVLEWTPALKVDKENKNGDDTFDFGFQLKGDFLDEKLPHGTVLI